MKILALTDIHGAYHIAEKILLHEKPDLLILGGDLTNAGTLKDVQGAVKELHNHCKKIFCVAGNMDLPHHDDWYTSEGISLNGTGMIIDDVGFFGVSAAPVSPLRTPYEITEEEILRRIETGYRMIQSCGRIILVSHPPPYGTKVDIVHAGYHVGSTAVREFIEEKKPDLVICGHIHEGRGYDTIEKTKIVNCGYGHNGYYALIDIGKDIQVNIRQFPL
ncbi:MAG: metallophosphoesterase [Bacteroidota bacterium]